MFLTPLNGVSKLVKSMFQPEQTFFCSNQHHFVGRLPIKIFYFADFQ